MEIKYIVYLAFVHWVADFIWQSDDTAKRKGKDNVVLTKHVSIYTLIIAVTTWVYFPYTSPIMSVAFVSYIFVMHWVTDYCTARVASYFHNKGDIHNFYVTIGFDQFLHHLQLVVGAKLFLLGVLL